MQRDRFGWHGHGAVLGTMCSADLNRPCCTRYGTVLEQHRFENRVHEYKVFDFTSSSRCTWTCLADHSRPFTESDRPHVYGRTSPDKTSLAIEREFAAAPEAAPAVIEQKLQGPGPGAQACLSNSSTYAWKGRRTHACISCAPRGRTRHEPIIS